MDFDRQPLIAKYVFIDTEAFRADGFDWLGAKFSKLLEFAKSGKLRILITDITKQEVYLRLKECANNLVAETKKHAVLMRQLGSGLEKDENGVFEILKKRFDQFLSDANVIDVPLRVNLKALFDDYFSRKPPFSQRKKDEFPDAVVIASLLEWCKEKETSAYVVSGDPDFEACCRDTKSLHHTKRIADVISYATVSKETEDKVCEYLSNNAEVSSALEDSIGSLWVKGDGRIEASVHGDVYKVAELNILSISVYSNNGSIYECEIELEAEVNIRISINTHSKLFADEQWIRRCFYADVTLDFNEDDPEKSAIVSVHVPNDDIEIGSEDLESWYG